MKNETICLVQKDGIYIPVGMLFEEFKQNPQVKTFFVPSVLERMHLRNEIYSAEDFRKRICGGDEHLEYYAEICPDITSSEALGIVDCICDYGGSVVGLFDATHRKYVGDICPLDNNPEFIKRDISSGSGINWRGIQVIDF